jgi:hypothetical protein
VVSGQPFVVAAHPRRSLSRRAPRSWRDRRLWRQRTAWPETGACRRAAGDTDGDAATSRSTLPKVPPSCHAWAMLHLSNQRSCSDSRDHLTFADCPGRTAGRRSNVARGSVSIRLVCRVLVDISYPPMNTTLVAPNRLVSSNAFTRFAATLVHRPRSGLNHVIANVSGARASVARIDNQRD